MWGGGGGRVNHGKWMSHSAASSSILLKLGRFHTQNKKSADGETTDWLSNPEQVLKQPL